MNFNLKNRYRIPTTLPMDIQKYLVKNEKWFEGFEKELREHPTYAMSCPNSAKLVIKEILGE